MVPIAAELGPPAGLSPGLAGDLQRAGVEAGREQLHTTHPPTTRLPSETPTPPRARSIQSGANRPKSCDGRGTIPLRQPARGASSPLEPSRGHPLNQKLFRRSSSRDGIYVGEWGIPGRGTPCDVVPSPTRKAGTLGARWFCLNRVPVQGPSCGVSRSLGAGVHTPGF